MRKKEPRLVNLFRLSNLSNPYFLDALVLYFSEYSFDNKRNQQKGAFTGKCPFINKFQISKKYT